MGPSAQQKQVWGAWEFIELLIKSMTLWILLKYILAS